MSTDAEREFVKRFTPIQRFKASLSGNEVYLIYAVIRLLIDFGKMILSRRSSTDSTK